MCYSRVRYTNYKLGLSLALATALTYSVTNTYNRRELNRMYDNEWRAQQMREALEEQVLSMQLQSSREKGVAQSKSPHLRGPSE
jgi:hypothetical protein